MSSNLPVPYIPSEKSGQVRITSAAHPLTMARTFFYAEVGKSVKEVVESTVPLHFRNSVFVTINGEYVPRETWEKSFVYEEDIVVVRAVPQGGGHGGGGKQILQVVAMLAIIVIATVVAGPMGLGAAIASDLAVTTAAGIATITALTATAITAIGNLLINSLIPPSRLPASTQQFGVSGIQNEALPYGTVPRLYGRTLFTPPKGALSFTLNSNNFQYLYCLFDLGPGPLNITDLKIGNTPIDDFSDLEYQVLEGTPDDAPQTIFTNAVTQTPFSVGLIHLDDTTTQETGLNVTNIQVDLTFPGGLYATNGSGAINSTGVNFLLTIVSVTTGDTVYSRTLDVSAASNSAVFQTFAVGAGFAEFGGGAAIPADQYRITLTRETDHFTDSGKGSSDAYMTAIRTFGPLAGPLLPVGHAQVAMKIRATEQINGDISNFNCIAQRYVQVWNGTSWSSELNTHPAWAAYDCLTGGSNARALDPSQVDVDTLYNWAQTYPSAEFNYVFSGRTTVWQALRTIGSAGRATPCIQNGLYSFIFDRVQSEGPVQMFTAKNVSGFKVSRAFINEIQGMEVRYIAETQGWQQFSQYIYAAGITPENVDFNFVSTLDLVGVTSDAWAFKLGSYFFNCSVDRVNTYQFTTDLDHLACNPGDRVWVQHDIIGAGIVAGRITGITRDPTTHKLTGFTTDELVTGDGVSSYAIIGRTSDNTIYTIPITVPADQGNAFTTSPAFDDTADELNVGDLVSFVTTTVQLLDGIVKSIAPKPDFQAMVTLLDYDAAVHNGDNVTPPTYTNGYIQEFIFEAPVSTVSITKMDASEVSAISAADGTMSMQLHTVFQPNNDGLPPAYFECQWQVNGNPNWSSVPNLPATAREVYIPLSYTVIGQAINVRIRGNTASGTDPGAWAEGQLTITDFLVQPAQPTNFTVVPIIGGVKGTITADESGGVYSKFAIYYTSNISDVDFADAILGYEGTSQNYTITGLSSTTVYNFWAVGIGGNGVQTPAIGPISGLPLPVGLGDLDVDITQYLNFVGQALRDTNDAISEISQAVTNIGLGNRVDFTTLQDGYTNLITETNTVVSGLTTDFTGLQNTLVGYSATSTVASAILTVQTQVTTDGTNISANSSSITAIQSALNGYNGANAVSTAINSINTSLSTINGNITTQSTEITNLTSALTGYTGASAVSTAISGINTSLTTLNGDITTQATQISSLTSALSGYTGAGAVSTAISNLNTSVTTLNGDFTTQASAISSINSTLTGYSPSVTVAAAVSGLQTQVTTNAGNITSVASSVSAVSTQVGNFYASGLFRVSATSSGISGSVAEVAIEVAASSGVGASTAAMYLDAMSGGSSRITLIADQIFFTDGSTNTNPFFYTGGTLYLNNVVVQNVIADNITSGTFNVGLISAGAVTTTLMASNSITNSSVATGSSSVMARSVGAQALMVGLTMTTVGGNVLIQFTDYFQRSSGHSPTAFYILYRDGTQIASTDSGGSGITVFQPAVMSFLDTSLSAGSHTYDVYAYVSSGDDPDCVSEAPTIVCTELKR